MKLTEEAALAFFWLTVAGCAARFARGLSWRDRRLILLAGVAWGLFIWALTYVGLSVPG